MGTVLVPGHLVVLTGKTIWLISIVHRKQANAGIGSFGCRFLNEGKPSLAWASRARRERITLIRP